MNLLASTWCICCLAICISTSESSSQDAKALRNNLHGIKIRDESGIWSSSGFLTSIKKIHLMRYYLGKKIPGEKIAVVLDTADVFYEDIKRLWKLVENGGQINSDIMIFVYNDTDCSLITTTKKDDRKVSEVLDKISGSFSTSDLAGDIFECVNLAQSLIKSDSSVMVLTGRKAGDEFTIGKNTGIEMMKKRIEFNVIWCSNDAGTPEEVNGYKQITRNTNGHFIEFTKIDQESITKQDEVYSEKGYKTGNYYNKSTNFSLDVERTFSVSKIISRDETADLLYDPKILPNHEKSFDEENRFRDSSRIVNEDKNERRESMEADDMKSASLTINDSVSRLETTAVEVTAATSLVGRPGGVSRLTFTVANNYPVTIRHYFQAKSTSFNVVYLEPRNAWIESGQSITVVADVLVPTTATTSTTGTVTLTIQGIGSVEKSAYIYVRETGSAIYDTTKPTINYSFNNNCAGKFASDTCSSNLWTVDVTVRDSDSGLQRVSSSPKGIQAVTTFISGTKSTTRFQYAGTCCQTSVIITAEDLLGNSNTETIEVTVWWNLSEGEIAAIVVGTLLLLLIIVIIVLIVICCIRRRKKSQDLPYTQRRQAVVQQN